MFNVKCRNDNVGGKVLPRRRVVSRRRHLTLEGSGRRRRRWAPGRRHASARKQFYLN